MRQSFFDYCRQYHKEALLREWDTARNAPLTPQAVTYGSHTPVWWRCENGHEWEAVVYTRTHGSGCPFCAGKKGTSRLQRSGNAVSGAGAAVGLYEEYSCITGRCYNRQPSASLVEM